MTQDKNGLPTIGQYPSFSRKDEERIRWQGLSNLWNAYADILGKIPAQEEQEESIYARIKASDYAKKLIDSMEEENKD